jgi:hypothetical protein
METEKKSKPKRKNDTALELMAGDTLIYLALVLMIWGVWRLAQQHLFTAGDDIGYWLGVTGAVMMLALFTYPLRKYFRFAGGWGSIKWWFWIHMTLGVLGPLFILLHSTFRIASLNAAVAFWSMIIVAGSGVIGRFLYQRVNRGLHGEKTDLKTLLERAGLDKEDARSRLAFAPKIESRLKEFEKRETESKGGLIESIRKVTWLPLNQQFVYLRCARELDALLPKMAKTQNWSKEDLIRRRKMAKKMVARYSNSVVRVSQFSAYSSLFSLWHVAHIPFVYVLVITALVHVYAVHVY